MTIIIPIWLFCIWLGLTGLSICFTAKQIQLLKEGNEILADELAFARREAALKARAA